MRDQLIYATESTDSTLCKPSHAHIVHTSLVCTAQCEVEWAGAASRFERGAQAKAEHEAVEQRAYANDDAEYDFRVVTPT